MRRRFLFLENSRPWRLYFGLLFILMVLAAVGSTVLPVGRIYQARVTNEKQQMAIKKADQQKLVRYTKQINDDASQWEVIKKADLIPNDLFPMLKADGKQRAQQLKASVKDLQTASNQLSSDLVGRETLLNKIQTLLEALSHFVS
jgi:uncharacterized protein YlxW (UPF0749 family)